MATRNKVDMGKTEMPASKLAGHLIGLLKMVQDDSFDQRHFEALAEGRDPFAAPKMDAVDVDDRVKWWRAHYQNIYRLNPDFSGFRAPKRQEGFHRLAVLPRGFKIRSWVETVSHIHGLDLHDNDLDAMLATNDRTSESGAYAVWIRDRQEADEELKNLSALMLAEQKVAGITLAERLVAGTAHLFETGRHMDVENWTSCTGSRYSDGDVPYVNWRPGDRELYVNRHDPGDRDGYLRSRAVVSL